jgi:hypothetical protein
MDRSESAPSNEDESLMATTNKATRDTLINAINHERDGLRNEIIQYESSMHRTMFAFITIAGVSAGIYFDKVGVSLSSSERPVILFLMSQVECFLSLFGMLLIAAQNMHAGYIRALEKKLNQLSGETISIWESEIVPRYMGHPRAAFFWANVLFVLSLVLVFLLFIAAAFSQINQMIYGVLLLTELFALATLLIFIAREPNKIAKFTEAKLSL